jgi:hypothetical protein
LAKLWPSVIDKPWLDELDEDSLPFFFDFFWVYYVEIVDGDMLACQQLLVDYG